MLAHSRWSWTPILILTISAEFISSTAETVFTICFSMVLANRGESSLGRLPRIRATHLQHTFKGQPKFPTGAYWPHSAVASQVFWHLTIHPLASGTPTLSRHACISNYPSPQNSGPKPHLPKKLARVQHSTLRFLHTIFTAAPSLTRTELATGGILLGCCEDRES